MGRQDVVYIGVFYQYPAFLNHGSELGQVCRFSHSNLSNAASRLIANVDLDDDKDFDIILRVVSPEEAMKLESLSFNQTEL